MSALPARDDEYFDDPVAPPEPVVVPARSRRRTARPTPVGTPGTRRTTDPPARRRTGVSKPERDRTRQRARRSRPTVEPPPEPVRAPRTPFVMLVVVLISAGIIGLLALNTKINENSFQLEGMRDRQAALDTREQQLKSELADKQSPGNLAAAAKRLGLVRADNPAFLHLPDGRVLGVPQPGGAGIEGR